MATTKPSKRRRIAVGLRKTDKNHARAKAHDVPIKPTWMKSANKAGLIALGIGTDATAVDLFVVGKHPIVVGNASALILHAINAKAAGPLPKGPRKQGMSESERQRVGKGVRKLRGKGKGREPKPGIGRKSHPHVSASSGTPIQRIRNVLSNSSGPIGASEIARHVGIPASVLSRTLKRLIREKILTKSGKGPSTVYRLAKKSSLKPMTTAAAKKHYRSISEALDLLPLSLRTFVKGMRNDGHQARIQIQDAKNIRVAVTLVPEHGGQNHRNPSLPKGWTTSAKGNTTLFTKGRPSVGKSVTITMF